MRRPKLLGLWRAGRREFWGIEGLSLWPVIPSWLRDGVAVCCFGVCFRVVLLSRRAGLRFMLVLRLKCSRAASHYLRLLMVDLLLWRFGAFLACVGLFLAG